MDLGKLEKVMILIIVGVFVVSSVNLLGALANPITKEEAIEISRNSELVREGMATFGYFSFEAGYYNSSWVEQMKNYTIPWADPNEEWVKRATQAHREIYGKIPEGHSIWEVIWGFSASKGIWTGYTVNVIVDSETGAIIHDAIGVGFD